jgi:hypothetical protein
MTECSYCGSDIERHDPVFVAETDSGQRISRGRFCNYACLSAYIEEEDLTSGAVCEWSP